MAYNPTAPMAGNAPGMMYASGASGAAPDASGGADPYQAIIEAEKRQQQESDRQYQISLGQLKVQQQQLAVSQGQAAANAWYNQQQVALTTAKMAEDKRQFDITTANGQAQFQQQQAQLAKQFDTSTAEGKRQFDVAQTEAARQYNTTFVNNQAEFQASQGQQQAQFQAAQAQQQSQFDVTTQQTADKMKETAREFDLTTEIGQEQFAKTFGLDVDKVKEQARQYDLTRGDQVAQFAQTLAENQRQFNTTATGYTDTGQATLDREKFNNQSLFDWTKQAIDLASTPQDWVKYKQMASGVSSNIGSIPGLNWAQGGQVGNTAFAGTPQANSLQHVLGDLGVNGQPAAAQAVPSNVVPITQGAAQQAPGIATDTSAAATGGQNQPVTNWANAAASMVPTGDALKASLNPQEQQIYSTADAFARNPQGAASGWYENLDPSTKSMIQGAAQAQGHDWTTVMSRYNRSRWGSGGGAMAA